MKKEMILVIFILLFVSASFSTMTFTYPSFDGERTNSPYSVSWLWEDPNWLCFKLFEDEISIANYVDNISDQFSAASEGNFSYQVFAYGSSDCLGTVRNVSLEFNLIIDTSPPSVTSKSPLGINENATGFVSVFFDEPMNTGHTTLTSGVLTGSPTWTNGDKTVTQDYSGNKGIAYSVNVTGKDLAGNTVSDSISFITGVDPEVIVINSPSDGDSFTQNVDTTEISVTITGGPLDSPCLGATVVTSGACSAVLTEGVDGVYTGSCSFTDYGSKTLTITATKGTASEQEGILLTIDKNIGLTIAVRKPTSFDLLRGESVEIQVAVLSNEEEGDLGTPVSGAVVSAPGISFVPAGSGFYKGTLSTNYLSGEGSNYELSFRINASATINGQDRSSLSDLITFTMQTVDLDVGIAFLQNDAEIIQADPGKSISLKINAAYPDGSAAIGTVSGTFKVLTEAKESKEIDLIFTKSGNNYVTESIHTSGEFDSAYTASITFTDATGNSGTSEFSIQGPALGLRFEPMETELVFSPGQEVEIIGRVRSLLEDELLTNVQIEFENKTYVYSVGVGGYVIPYKISSDSASGSKSLMLVIKRTSIDYLSLLPIMISKDLGVIAPASVEKGKLFKIQITYPNEELVTEGNFSITALGEIYELKKDGDYWTANINLGAVDTTASLLLSGTDAFGNKISAAAETIDVEYTISIFEQAKANPLQVSLIALGIIFAAFIVSYVWSYSRIKAGLTVSKADLIRRYKHLLLEKEKLAYLKKKIRVDVMQRRISQDEAKVFERESLQRSTDLLSQLSEMESNYDYIRQEKDKYEQASLIEIEKIKPYLKQNIMEEAEIAKAMVSIKKQVEYGTNISEIKSKIMNKYSRAGKKAIRRAEIEGLLRKKTKVKEIGVDPVKEAKKLMQSGSPEQAIKKSFMNQGMTEAEARDIINKAKRL